jgi:hypothetical protein
VSVSQESRVRVRRGGAVKVEFSKWKELHRDGEVKILKLEFTVQHGASIQYKFFNLKLMLSINLIPLKYFTHSSYSQF